MSELAVAILVTIGIIGKVSPVTFYALAGFLVIFHPLLILKGNPVAAEYLSSFIFFCLISGAIVFGFNRVFRRVEPEDVVQRFIVTHALKAFWSIVSLIVAFAIPYNLTVSFGVWILSLVFLWRLNSKTVAAILITLFTLSAVMELISQRPFVELLARTEFIGFVVLVVLQFRNVVPNQ